MKGVICQKPADIKVLTSFKEYLKTPDIDKIFKVSYRPLCSTCGMIKRYIFNKFAKENGFDKVAIGYCADFLIKFFFKNFESGYFDWIFIDEKKS